MIFVCILIGSCLSIKFYINWSLLGNYGWFSNPYLIPTINSFGLNLNDIWLHYKIQGI